MLALRTSPPLFSIAEAERIARDLYGLAVDARSLSGERDCNFHLRTADERQFVLKVLGPDDAEGADCLVRVLDHLAEQGPRLPVPRLFATQDGRSLGRVTRGDTDHAVCLVSYLPGSLLAAAADRDTGLLEEVGLTLAGLDRALRGFFHPALNRRLAWDVRRLPELGAHVGLLRAADVRRDVETVMGRLHQALPRLRALRSQAVHGDCHGTNLLVADVGPARRTLSGILDFGDMIHAPLILEPAICMSELLTEGVAGITEVGAVLRGFGRGQALEAADIAAVYDIIRPRHAVGLLVHAFRREHDAAGAEALAASAHQAARSLRELLELGVERMTKQWSEAAGIDGGAPAGASESPAAKSARSPVDLARRHRLMGKGAELFYEKPLHLVRGEGVWMFDPEGRAYLDVYNNVPHVGHSHPRVVEAIQRQAGIIATHSRYLHEGILDYAERLIARLPAHLDACIFVNSGSEANDVAWRMAKLTTGRSGALVMENAYHGITDAVAELTPSTGSPRDPRVVTVPPPPADLAYDSPTGKDEAARAVGVAQADAAIATLTARGHEPAAFYIDTAITSSGVFDPPPAWGRAPPERIRAAGALIVADEVQYGLGRPGSHFWGFERRGMVPDIVTLGKPVANGFPMGVVAARRELIEALQAEFGFFSTFGGNAVAAAAATAVLDVLEREKLMESAAQVGGYLRGRLEAVAARHPEVLGQVRGCGLLFGVEVRGSDLATTKKRTKGIINHLASAKRILIGYEGPHATLLKLRPPMPFQREHADRLADAIDEAAGISAAR